MRRSGSCASRRSCAPFAAPLRDEPSVGQPVVCGPSGSRTRACRNVPLWSVASAAVNGRVDVRHALTDFQGDADPAPAAGAITRPESPSNSSAVPASASGGGGPHCGLMPGTAVSTLIALSFQHQEIMVSTAPYPRISLVRAAYEFVLTTVLLFIVVTLVQWLRDPASPFASPT
jgi:hypothetical protein